MADGLHTNQYQKSTTDNMLIMQNKNKTTLKKLDIIYGITN